MGHARVGDRAFGRADAELRGGGPQQHLARRGAGDAHAVVSGAAHRHRSAGDLQSKPAREAVGAVVETALEWTRHVVDERAHDVGVRIRIERRRFLHAHEVPVGVHLLRGHHGERGLRALTHLAVRDEDRDDVVGRHQDPRGELAALLGVLGTEPMASRRKRGSGHAEDEPAADERAGADERASRPLAHYAPPCSARPWIALRMRAKVPQRQMLVMAASMSASVACGRSASSADTAMIIPDWQ